MLMLVCAGIGVLSYLLRGWLGERWGLRQVLIGTALLVPPLNLAFLLAHEHALLVAVYFLIYQVTNGTWSGAGYAYQAESFPTRVRGTAVGLLGAMFAAGILLGAALWTLLMTVSTPAVTWLVIAVGARVRSVAHDLPARHPARHAAGGDRDLDLPANPARLAQARQSGIAGSSSRRCCSIAWPQVARSPYSPSARRSSAESNAGQLDLAAPLELDRHRLTLQRVHARQTAAARLVELHRTALVLVRRRGLGNLGAPRPQPRHDGGIVSLRFGHRENMGARPAFGHSRGPQKAFDLSRRRR